MAAISLVLQPETRFELSLAAQPAGLVVRSERSSQAWAAQFAPIWVGAKGDKGDKGEPGESLTQWNSLNW